MNKYKVLFMMLTAAFALSLSSTAAAAGYWYKAGLEWQDPAQFNGNTPTALDEVFLGHGRTGWVASSGNVVGILKIGAAAKGGNLFILESGDLTANTIQFDPRVPLVDTVELRGGTLTIHNHINSWASKWVMRIVGSGGTLAGAAVAHVQGTLEFVVDSTGITPIPWTVDFDSNQAVVRIKGDGAMPGTYRLFTGTLQDTWQPTIQTVNPGNGLYWDTTNLWVDGTVELKSACWATNPVPEDGMVNLLPSQILSWDAPGVGCNPNPVFDVYFGTDPNFPGGPAISGLTDSWYDPYGAADLDFGTTYYWKIDVEGNEDNEVIWSFTTEPLKAITPIPADKATGIVPEVSLTWSAPASISNLTYDLYLADPNSYDPNFPDVLPLVASGLLSPIYTPDQVLRFSTDYIWRVDIHSNGQVYVGDTWQFNTKAPARKLLEWKMDAASGTMVEDTAGSTHGTAYNDPNWVSGLSGNGLAFFDQGDYVQHLNATSLPAEGSAPWSINMYVYLEKPFAHWTVLGGFGSPVGGTSGNARYLMNMNNHITGWVNGNALETQTGFDLGWWQMLTITHDGRILKVFKNGQLIGSKEVMLSEALPQVFLSPLDAWNQGHVRGKIDEFTIWDNDLTQGEIDTLTQLIPLKGDLNNDGAVDINDLTSFAGLWLDSVPECAAGSVVGDFNGDCAVDLVDFIEIANKWMAGSL